MSTQKKKIVQWPMRQKISAILFVLLFASIGTYFLLSSYADSYPHNNFPAPPAGSDAVYPDFAGANWVDHNAGEVFTQTAYVSYNMEPGSARQINLYFSYNPNLVKLLDVTCVTSWGCKKSKWNSSISGTHQGTDFVVCVDAPVGRYSNKLIYTMSMQAKRNLNGGGGNGYAPDAWFVGLAGIAPGSCSSNPTGKNTQWSWLQGRCGTINGTVYPDCYNGTNPDTPGFNGFSPLTTRSAPRTTNTQSTNSNNSSNSSGSSTAKLPNEKPNTVPSSSGQGDTKQPELYPSPFYDGKQYKQGSTSDASFGGLLAKDAGLRRVTSERLVVAALLLVGVAGGGYWWWRKRIKRG